MKFSLFFFFILLISIQAFAQDQQAFDIKGKVNDPAGQPVLYCTVQIDSLSIATVTEADGSYELKSVPQGNHTLTIKAFGFQAKTIRVAVRKEESVVLNISLQEDISTADSVIVIGKSEKEKIESSALAVDVIETKTIKLQTADMGEVMAQTQGVSVRRSGGLGSDTRFSLNGLSGDQIRFFQDGIPLEFNGYLSGISNVPVNLVDRIEVYKGVVPIQFGADALGGAVNLVSPKMYPGLGGSASYQTGSFGTHRATLDIKHFNDSTGLFVGVGGFYDYAKNNYKVDVDVPNDKGKLSEQTIRRFHDKYRAGGMHVVVGIKDKKWAKELSVKGFYTDYLKELQNNNLMEGIPWGDVVTLRNAAGVNLTYRKEFGDKISLNVMGGYNQSERQLVDTSHAVYNWYGERILIKNKPGEIDPQAGGSHLLTWDKNTYARLFASWKIAKHHSVRVSIAPTYTLRTADEKYLESYDPNTARRSLLTWVNGLEYKWNAFNDKLENILFVKDYVQQIESKDMMFGSVTKRHVHYYGIGNGVRYEFSHRLAVKLSYEYATRLPRPDELFGDGQLTMSSLDLEPERSHNGNLEITLKNRAKANWYIQANAFIRKIDNLILLIPSTDRDNIYRNVYEAISTGLELSAGWTSQNEKISLNANSTYQKYYNSSKEGVFGDFYGDRIPNTPYFFYNASASYSFRKIFHAKDKLSPFWSMRYVHEFYRSWESAGLIQYKQTIPSQQIHSAGLTYRLIRDKLSWALTAEVQNLLDEKIFDFYGVQKPGRGFYIKITTQF